MPPSRILHLWLVVLAFSSVSRGDEPYDFNKNVCRIYHYPYKFIAQFYRSPEGGVVVEAKDSKVMRNPEPLEIFTGNYGDHRFQWLLSHHVRLPNLDSYSVDIFKNGPIKDYGTIDLDPETFYVNHFMLPFVTMFEDDERKNLGPVFKLEGEYCRTYLIDRMERRDGFVIKLSAPNNDKWIPIKAILMALGIEKGIFVTNDTYSSVTASDLK